MVKTVDTIFFGSPSDFHELNSAKNDDTAKLFCVS